MKLTKILTTIGFAAALAFGLSASAFADEHEAGEVSGAIETGGAAEGAVEENGTDPRDFAAKFMPYYRFNKLDNGLESHETTLFGLLPIPFGEMFFDNPEYKWAVTYEFPALKYVDASDPISRLAGAAGSIARSKGVSTPIAGAPPVPDDKVWGTGDLNVRLLIPIYEAKNLPVSFMTGSELWLPTASDDLLGTGKWQVAPHLTAVVDFAPGIFLASMNFWRTSFAGDGDRGDIELYVGRHFLNIPFGKSGFYTLTELQTICDLKDNNNWEVWIGPEFGKVLAPGRIVYAKPGFGIDADPSEREWSFELGYRHFF